MQARLKQTFNPLNEEDISFIKKELAVLSRCVLDIKLLLAGMTTIFIAGSVVSSLLPFQEIRGIAQIIMYAALIFIGVMKWGNELQKAYQDQLDKVYKIYVWCGKSGVQVTHNEIFIDILKAIHKDVPFDYLLLWDVKTQLINFSNEFIDLLVATDQKLLPLLKPVKNASRSPIENKWLTAAKDTKKIFDHCLFAYQPTPAIEQPLDKPSTYFEGMKESMATVARSTFGIMYKS